MKKYFVLLSIVALAIVSCKKEVVQAPPVVPPVEDSNHAFGVVYSIHPEDWATDEDSLSYSASFDVPELTDAIFDHGAVITYLSFKDSVYEALPEVFGGIAYGAIHSPGFVTVDFHALDGFKLLPPDGIVYAKIVLIAADKIALHPDVNLQDYNEVKRVFNLK